MRFPEWWETESQDVAAETIDMLTFPLARSHAEKVWNAAKAETMREVFERFHVLAANPRSGLDLWIVDGICKVIEAKLK